MALVLAKWGPVILQCLPHIIRVGHHLYALWCSMRGTQQQNSAVVRAMHLLIKHEDDISRLLQNPGQKRELVEGLAILINKINQSNHNEIGNRGNDMMVPSLPPLSRSPSAPKGHTSPSYEDCGAASIDKYPNKDKTWKMCSVCLCDYDFLDKKPTILICGHTFCRECLREVFRRTQNCPTCRQLERRPLADIPLNMGLMRVLETEQENKSDESSFNGSGCEDMALSFEQQIQFAIFRSQQQAESQGPEYVEARWRELECAEDESLARAIQVSLFYEDSRLCAQQQQSESAFIPHDEGENEVCEAVTCDDEDEAASLKLALQLQQEENYGGNDSSPCENQCHIFNSASSCALVEREKNTTQEQDEKGVSEREEDKDEDEGDGAMCCGSRGNKEKDDGEESQTRCTEGGATSCSRRQDERKKGDDKEEECQVTCIEDDCEDKVFKDEFSAILKAQEDALLELAIQLSLKKSSD